MSERLRFPDEPIRAKPREGEEPAPQVAAGEQLCPACGGARYATAIACGPKVSAIVRLPCYLCTAEGKVATRRAIAVVEGRRLRERRIIAYRSQPEAARALGMTPQEYSKLENGTAPFELYERAGITLPV